MYVFYLQQYQRLNIFKPPSPLIVQSGGSGCLRSIKMQLGDARRQSIYEENKGLKV